MVTPTSGYARISGVRPNLVNVEHRVWRISATYSKSGKVRTVLLNDSAQEILSKQDTKD